MKTVQVSALALTWPLCVAGALVAGQPRHTLLQLQRTSVELPPAFAGPVENAAELNLKGFCKRPDKKPACLEQPCCCWSTWAANKHPAYPNEAEVRAMQECLNPPKGFRYAPEPGLTYDDGYLATLKNQGFPVYDGRRLCCLRRDLGVQDESQRDLALAIKTTTTTTVTTTTVPGVVEEEPVGVTVPPLFTTEIVTTSLLNPGDEYETAQMEAAAREHLKAADDLMEAVGAINASTAAVAEVRDYMETDPNLVRSRKHVAQMNAAIDAWRYKRWSNLAKLEAGDASAFEPVSAPPLVIPVVPAPPSLTGPETSGEIVLSNPGPAAPPGIS